MTKKNVIILFIVVGVVAAVGGWLSAEALAAKIKQDRLTDGLGELKVAVEAYAMDHLDSYPASLDELVAAGFLEKMPENPYTHEPMPVLEPEDDPVPGGVVYVGYGGVSIDVVDSDPQYIPKYLLVVYAGKPVDKHHPDTEGEYWEDVFQKIEWSWVACAAGGPVIDHVYYIKELQDK